MNATTGPDTGRKGDVMSDEEGAESRSWRDRQPLNGTDVTDFLALRRVCERPDFQVDRVGGQYVENGRPVLPFLADGLAALIEVGHLSLGEPETRLVHDASGHGHSQRTRTI
jgi:hypothetical protein